jgi:hypothetical protein
VRTSTDEEGDERDSPPAVNLGMIGVDAADVVDEETLGLLDSDDPVDTALVTIATWG